MEQLEKQLGEALLYHPSTVLHHLDKSLHAHHSCTYMSVRKHLYDATGVPRYLQQHLVNVAEIYIATCLIGLNFSNIAVLRVQKVY